MVRTDPELVGDELHAGDLQFLELHRAKRWCEGQRAHPTNSSTGPRSGFGWSTMTLAGMVKHLALVEDELVPGVRLLAKPIRMCGGIPKLDEDHVGEMAHGASADAGGVERGSTWAHVPAAGPPVAEVRGDLGTGFVRGAPTRRTERRRSRCAGS